MKKLFLILSLVLVSSFCFAEKIDFALETNDAITFLTDEYEYRYADFCINADFAYGITKNFAVGGLFGFGLGLLNPTVKDFNSYGFVLKLAPEIGYTTETDHFKFGAFFVPIKADILFAQASLRKDGTAQYDYKYDFTTLLTGLKLDFTFTRLGFYIGLYYPFRYIVEEHRIDGININRKTTRDVSEGFSVDLGFRALILKM